MKYESLKINLVNVQAYACSTMYVFLKKFVLINNNTFSKLCREIYHSSGTLHLLYLLFVMELVHPDDISQTSRYHSNAAVDVLGTNLQHLRLYILPGQRPGNRNQREGTNHMALSITQAAYCVQLKRKLQSVFCLINYFN